MTALGPVTTLTLLAVISLQELLLLALPAIENAAYTSQDLLADESAVAMSVQVEPLAPLTRQRRHDYDSSEEGKHWGRHRGHRGHDAHRHGRGRGHEHEHYHGHGHRHGPGRRHGSGHGCGHGQGRPDVDYPATPQSPGIFFGPYPDNNSENNSRSSQETPNVPNSMVTSPALPPSTTKTPAPSITQTTKTTSTTTISTTEDPNLGIDIRIGTD